MFEPWQVAATRRVTVFLADLGPYSGATDGTHVWLHPHLNAVEARCTLAHELEHIDAGHYDCQTSAVERTIRERVARRLIPFSRLLGFAQSQRESPWAIAEAMDVSTGVLRDRLRALTAEERAALQAASII